MVWPIYVLGTTVAAFIWSSYDAHFNGEFIGPTPPIQGEGGLIDIDTPIGDINIDNKLLLLPVLWLVLKYKPWK